MILADIKIRLVGNVMFLWNCHGISFGLDLAEC